MPAIIPLRPFCAYVLLIKELQGKKENPQHVTERFRIGRGLGTNYGTNYNLVLHMSCELKLSYLCFSLRCGKICNKR